MSLLIARFKAGVEFRSLNPDYLETRHILCQLWGRNDGACFAVLPDSAQMNLHDYFAPSVQMWDDEALEHRKKMTTKYPSLPQKAGCAYEALSASLEGRPNKMLERHRANMTFTVQTGRKSQRIRVSAVRRPNLDYERIARMLLDMVRDDKDGSLVELLESTKKGSDRKRP